MRKILIWCNLNAEQDALERLFGDLCVSIQGSTPNEKKIELEEKWREGDVPIMISKPSVFGYGMNWQHCSVVLFVGLSDSYEQLYQAIRRCWRFGQKNKVNVHIITADVEGASLRNIKRKESDALSMAESMVEHMHMINEQNIKGTRRQSTVYNPTKKMEIPSWM